MYHVPENKTVIDYPAWHLFARYLWFCFIGLWIVNIPLIILSYGWGIMILFFYQWIYFAPFFVGSALFYYVLLRRFHRYNHQPRQSYQQMLLWGFFSGLLMLVLTMRIESELFFFPSWWRRISMMVGIMSGQFAVGGMVSIKQYTYPSIEWRGILAIASVTWGIVYIIM